MMKYRKTILLLSVLAALFCAVPSLAAMRQGSGSGTNAGAESGAVLKGTYDAATLAPSGVTVLFVVAANGEEKNATGDFYAYVKTENGWEEKMAAVPAKLGRGGIGKEIEGDQKTPLGTFLMNTPFGIKGAEEGFPSNYKKVTAANYWSGEHNGTYNKFCDTGKDGQYTGASEHLIDYAGYYNYAINTGYNPGCEIGKGSALFLHCVVNGQNTGGCIAIPASDMKKALTYYRDGKTAIVIRRKGDF